MKMFRRKFLIFSYFCSEHRLWVHVRTASPMRYPRFGAKIRKIGVPLHSPVLLYTEGHKFSEFACWSCTYDDGSGFKL